MTMDLETFARLRAHLACDPLLAHALPLVGGTTGALTEISWREEEEAWLARLAEDLERGSLERIRIYQTVYEQAFRERAGIPAPLAPRGSLQGAVGRSVEAQVKVVEASFQRADSRPIGAAPDPLAPPAPLPATGAPAAAFEVRTEEIDPDHVRFDLPFAAGASSLPPGRVPAPHEAAGTVAIAPPAGRPELPFARARPTVALLPSDFLVPAEVGAAPALPRVPTPAALPPTPLQSGLPRTVMLREVPLESPPSPTANTEHPPHATVFLRGEPAPAGAPLPFAEERGPEVKPAAGAGSAEPDAGRGMTHAPSAAAGRRAAIPFASPSAPLLPLEDYARIHAALLREGEPEKTFARLGVDPVMWMSAVRRYAQKLDADPAMKAAFDDLVEKALKHGH